MKQIDARVRYTRMIIEQSFLALLREKPCARITVTELCQRAEINRATFYKHYLDIPDLLEKLEEELLTKIRSVFSALPLSYETFMLELLRYIRDNDERISILASDSGDPNLMTRAFMLCTEYAYPIFSEKPFSIDEKTRPLLYDFICHGVGGILTGWIQGGMQQSPEEINSLILSLCEAALDGYALKQN